VDGRLIALPELQHRLGEDPQLASVLRLHYGPNVAHLRFRLIGVPLTLLEDYRLDDFDEHFECLIERDHEYDATMLLCGEAPEWPWEDAEDRYLIARGYVDAFRTGKDIRPVVVDRFSMADLAPIYMVDGHHRTHAAHEAGVAELLAYEIVLGRR
jgi:hypothetical protein